MFFNVWNHLQGDRTDSLIPRTVSASFVRACTSLCLAVAVAGCASSPGSRKSQAEVVPPPPPIRIESVRVTAAGHYLDLRYSITDVERATALFSPQVKVRMALVDEQTGKEMLVPETAKLGALRQLARRPETGRTYFVMFDNQIGVGPGRTVKAVVGDYEFPGLKVE